MQTTFHMHVCKRSNGTDVQAGFPQKNHYHLLGSSRGGIVIFRGIRVMLMHAKNFYAT